MTASWKSTVLGLGAALALCATVLPATAQRIVPTGQTTYYFSGTTADPLNPSNPNDRGSTVQQADNILNKLQAMLQKSGLTFGDVVQAHVFLVTDPAKGDMDFAGLNSEWSQALRHAYPAQPAVARGDPCQPADAGRPGRDRAGRG